MSQAQSDLEIRVLALEYRLAQLEVIYAALTQRVVALEQSVSQAWNASLQT
jgi:uncharacterized coiled-coil protein SlyX